MHRLSSVYMQIQAYESAVNLLKTNGARVVYPLEVPDQDVLNHKGETLTTVACENALPSDSEPITNDCETMSSPVRFSVLRLISRMTPKSKRSPISSSGIRSTPT